MLGIPQRKDAVNETDQEYFDRMADKATEARGIRAPFKAPQEPTLAERNAAADLHLRSYIERKWGRKGEAEIKDERLT